MNDYPLLAHALLDCGDKPETVVDFLSAEYGLRRTEARAALSESRAPNDEHTPAPAQTRRRRTRSIA